MLGILQRRPRGLHRAGPSFQQCMCTYMARYGTLYMDANLTPYVHHTCCRVFRSACPNNASEADADLLQHTLGITELVRLISSAAHR